MYREPSEQPSAAVNDHADVRYSQGHIVLIGPHVEPHKFKSRREAKDWCMEHHPGFSIKEIGADATRQARR